MSEPERTEEARRWLRYAHEDLASAAAMSEQGLGVPRQACWLAQQAVEKAIKAALVFLQIEFPKTHDLDLLRTLLPANWKVKSEPADLSELSEWSVEARYPGDWPEVTPSDAQRALSSAQEVMRSVLEDFRAHNVTSLDGGQ